MILAYILKITTNTEPFKLVGEIGSGLPTVGLPPFSTTVGNQTYTFIDMVQTFGIEFLVIPLVAILETVAIAKAFAEGGRIDATQEMIAVGLCNIVGSCVQSMPITGSFTRTALNYASGVKTPAGGVTKCILLIVCLSLLTYTFYYIPMASLAGLIMVAMFSMIDYVIFVTLWRNSKKECILLVLTMLICLFAGLEYGIVAGILLEGLLLLYMSSRPILEINSDKINNTEIITLPLCDSLSYCAAEHVRKVILKSSYQFPGLNTVFVIDGENLKHMDATVATNLMILVKDLENQKRIIEFINFKNKFKKLCVDIYPNADSIFVSAKPIV